MKTQNNKLAFSKNSIVELNSDQLNQVNGGTSTTTISTTSTIMIISIKGVQR